MLRVFFEKKNYRWCKFQGNITIVSLSKYTMFYSNYHKYVYNRKGSQFKEAISWSLGLLLCQPCMFNAAEEFTSFEHPKWVGFSGWLGKSTLNYLNENKIFHDY